MGIPREFRCGSWAVIILAGISLSGCGGDSERDIDSDPESVTESVTQVPVVADTAFALNFFSEVSKGEGNVVCSPFSISTALMMASAGARGETASEIEKVLGIQSPSEQAHQIMSDTIAALRSDEGQGSDSLVIANRLWGQKGYPFLPDYIKAIEVHYQGGFGLVDYENDSAGSAEVINQWVKDQTRGNISEIVSGAGLKGARLVLTNAIFFKGMWQKRFPAENTQPGSFYLDSGEQISVPMMRLKEEFKIGAGEACRLIEIPYLGGGRSMVVVLPDAKDGARELSTTLTRDRIAEWTQGMVNRDVVLRFPRFEVQWQGELGQHLQAMGIATAFGGKADFSGMTRVGGLSMGPVIHRCFVSVNEEGTVASAATAIEMTEGASRPEKFIVDHPFLFLIRDNVTGAILFIGRVVNPMPPQL